MAFFPIFLPLLANDSVYEDCFLCLLLFCKWPKLEGNGHIMSYVSNIEQLFRSWYLLTGNWPTKLNFLKNDLKHMTWYVINDQPFYPIPNFKREIYQSWRVGCYRIQKTSSYTQSMPSQLPSEAYFIFNMSLWWSKAGWREILFFSFWFWHPIIFSKLFPLALQNCFQKRRDPYQKSKVFVHFLPSAYRIFMKLFHGFMFIFS